MASPTPIAPARDHTGDDGGVLLPSDMVREILVRVPARPLCSFRAVCRAWRSMLSSDPAFAAAHASRHKAPLLTVAVTGGDDDDTTVELIVMDMSAGNKTRRRMPAGSWGLFATLRTHHHLAAIALLPDRKLQGQRRLCFEQVRVVDLESGAVSDVPVRLQEGGERHPYSLFLGRASSGEHKALLIRNLPDFRQQLCRVATINTSSTHGEYWREMQTPPAAIHTGGGAAVVGGIVYLLVYPSEALPKCYHHGFNNMLDGIASLDLASEQWSPTVFAGPLSSSGEEKYSSPRSSFGNTLFRLTALNDHLVLVHYNRDNDTMDLWFRCEDDITWCRRYAVVRHGDGLHQPLWELDDGRLAVLGYRYDTLGYKIMTVLRTYDPKTNTFLDVMEMKKCVHFSVYTPSLLSYC